jgi:crotonobetainyl-CoA:carnitine CoA-transferase CaiB-like acyl-CoA transferase
MTMPLEGVTVLSLEQAVAAPLATCRLADAGARVIKVERPEGDFARGYDSAGNGVSSYFAWINRGKESIALNLRDDEDRRVFDALLDRADVFVENLAVGATARLGYGGEQLRANHPRLIVCEMSGYGESGPYADAKAYDLLVQAESGLLSVSGAPGPMGRVGVSVVDIGLGMNAALAITQALYRAARTGEGALLRGSLFDSIAEWMCVPLLHFDYLGEAPQRVGLAHPSIAPYGAFATADGTLLLVSIQSDREWRALCTDVLGRPELGADERFATNAARVANRGDTDAIVAETFAAHRAQEMIDLLLAARIAYGRVNDVAGLSAHPHLRRVHVPHEHGGVDLPAPPMRTDWERIRPVPKLNEHGAAIRAEVAQPRNAG